MSKLPSGWTVAELGALTNDISYGTSEKCAYEPKLTPVLRIPNIANGRIDISDLKFAAFEAREIEKLALRPGDILIIRSNGSLGLVGRAALVDQNVEGFLYAGYLIRLRFDLRASDPAFVRHWLRAPETRAEIELAAKSTSGVNNISAEQLRRMRLHLPPLVEQRRVVAKLDALTARTARARADLDRIPALAARYKQAVLQKGFSGELTARWRGGRLKAAFSEAEIDLLKQRRRSYEEGRRGSRLRDMPELILPGHGAELPDSWAFSCVADVADLRIGYAYKSDWFTNSGVPLIRGANVGVGALDCDDLKFLSPERAEEYADYRLQAGDILLAMDRPVISAGLKAARVTSELAGALLVQRVACPSPSSLVDRGFLWWLFHSRHYLDQIERHATGTDLPHVSGNDILSTALPLPPISEQREVVRLIESAFAEIDRLTAEAASARKLLDRLDQAVLAKAFRGELVPQDPADEPASVLLDRIRAERASSPKAKSRRKVAEDV